MHYHITTSVVTKGSLIRIVRTLEKSSKGKVTFEVKFACSVVGMC